MRMYVCCLTARVCLTACVTGHCNPSLTPQYRVGESQRLYHRTLLTQLTEHLAQLTSRVDTEARLRRKLEDERALLFEQYTAVKAGVFSSDGRRGRAQPPSPLVCCLHDCHDCASG
jgi:hypothetical protein